MAIRALLLSDGIPGHYRCAEGILAAAGRMEEVSVTTLQVARPRYLPPDVLSFLTNRRVAGGFMLRQLTGHGASSVARPDLIVSAGGDTLAANIALARITGAANIFFGSLRRYGAADFTLALNSYTTDQPRENQSRILKPSPTDPDTLPPPPMDWSAPGLVGGLLVGGPTREAAFEDADWEWVWAFLTTTHSRLGITWIVSNSRRTPAPVSDRIQALASAATTPIRQFIDVRRAGAGTLSDLFKASAFVAVTADSSAMLSEAAWMRRPAIALLPARVQFTPKEQEYRSWLEGQGLCQSLRLSIDASDQLQATLRRVTPLVANPQAELASLLARSMPRFFPSAPGGS